MGYILELQHVSKTFSKSDFKLEDVTLSLPYGSILGFVGENGAGKTTTIDRYHRIFLECDCCRQK